MNEYKNMIEKYNIDINLLNSIEPTKELKLFLNILDDNKIIKMTKRGNLKKVKQEKVYIGRLQKKTTFGFVIVDNHADFYIQDASKYFDGDIVLIQEVDMRGKSDGAKILSLIKRENPFLIVKKLKNNSIVPIDKESNERIFLKGVDNEQIKPGTIFSVAIKELKGNKLIVTLHNIITDENDPDKEMKIVLSKFNIDVDFSEAALEELESIEEEISNKEMQNRVDLTDQVFFTIDGDDSKDLDDAISLIKEGQNYRLFVSIADVSHYLTKDSILEQEAYLRSTSVYFIDRVVPMIPKKISNGICSLHAGVNRLTLTCEMLINKQGQVIEKKIYESIINSNYRLTYKDINKLLINKDSQVMSKYADIYGILNEMNKLSKILNKKRLDRGAFNLEDTEAKFILDDEQNIIDILPVSRQDAEKMIEEFMIVANESVTKYAIEKDSLFLYRVHGTPNAKKLKDLRGLLHHLKINIDIDLENLDPQDFKKILEEVEDPIFKRILSKTIVRSMQKAVYSEKNIGHFGLASKNYTHFTSPIRRYPDLEVHYILKKLINEEKLPINLEESLKLISSHTSQKEVNAIKAEQEIEDKKKAQYMKKFISKSFKGTISSIEDYGIFVELENTIRGLIRFSDLKGYKGHNLYEVNFFQEPKLSFGQSLQVIVIGVDLNRGLVDFVPQEYDLYTDEEKFNIKQVKKKKPKRKTDNQKHSSKRGIKGKYPPKKAQEKNQNKDSRDKYKGKRKNKNKKGR